MTYWASCVKFTVLVDVDERGIIVGTAPIVSKFIGQPWERLRRWMAGLGGLMVERIAAHTPIQRCAPRGSHP